MYRSYDRAVIYWLVLVAFMVFLMVLIGGITRLTDSGLSIVDWKPIMGAIPPLSELQWQKVFDQYKQFPEFKYVNFNMTLSEFKFIYFWEYFHRLMGRLVGLVFFFPFVYFLLKKRITGYRFKLFIAFILGGSQGVLGWYMVKSGLVLRPDVSHFRLAAHLGLALFIIAYITWIIFEMTGARKAQRQLGKFRFLSWSFLILLSLQIIYGAFVAGLDAGVGYNTFPLMEGGLIATAATSDMGLFYDLLYNPAMIQFVHRVIGVSILLFSIYLFLVALKEHDSVRKSVLKKLCFITWLQVALGISTLVLVVPISLASIHQVMACLLLIYAVRFVYISLNKPMI